MLTNYPIALAAIGIVGVLLERGASRKLGVAAIVLCAVTAWPGVVDQGDLDARLVNVVPFTGVVLALALTLRCRPTLRLAPRRPLDRLRLVLAVVLVVAAIPWLFATTGFYAPNPIMADEVIGGDGLPAVHIGDHHGLDGVVLALSALLLSRVARSRALLALLSLMFVYGAANALQDDLLEQVVKRGWTDTGLPSMIVPRPSLAWAVILAASAAVWLAVSRAERAR